MSEHFLEADRIMVIMLGWIRGIKADVGKVQPRIDVDRNSTYTLCLQRTDEPLGEITFAGGIDPGDCSKNAPLGGY